MKRQLRAIMEKIKKQKLGTREEIDKYYQLSMEYFEMTKKMKLLQTKD